MIERKFKRSIPHEILFKLPCFGSENFDSILKRLQDKHSVEINRGDNDGFYIYGNTEEDIVETFVDVYPEFCDDSEKATIVWRFKDLDATHVKHLYKNEVSAIRRISSVKITREKVIHPHLYEIECSETVSEIVEAEVEKLVSRLVECKYEQKEVRDSDTHFAKRFERLDGGVFYGKLDEFDRKHCDKTMKIYSRSRTGIDEGLNAWENFKRATPGQLKLSKPVPTNVLQRLKELPEGFKSVIERVKYEYKVGVTYSDHVLTITGMNHDYLNLVIAELEIIVGLHKEIPDIRLGKATVSWMYRRPESTHIKYLLAQEIEGISAQDSTTVRYGSSGIHPTKAKIECEHVMFENINSRMKVVIKKLKGCKRTAYTVKLVHIEEMRQFQSQPMKGVYYGRSSCNDTVLKIYGRDEDSLIEGCRAWDLRVKFYDEKQRKGKLKVSNPIKTNLCSPPKRKFEQVISKPLLKILKTLPGGIISNITSMLEKDFDVDIHAGKETLTISGDSDENLMLAIETLEAKARLSFLDNCQSTIVELYRREKKWAKEFATTAFDSLIHVKLTDDGKMTIYGKDESCLAKGIAEWKEFKKNGHERDEMERFHCAVCLETDEKLEEDGVPFVTPKCGHVVCKGCADNWASNFCVSCKTPFGSDRYIIIQQTALLCKSCSQDYLTIKEECGKIFATTCGHLHCRTCTETNNQQTGHAGDCLKPFGKLIQLYL